MEQITKIASKLGLTENNIIQYGKYMAKIDLETFQRKDMNGKLILVTAITPTKAGEGKTTATIGLTDGLNLLGKKAVAVLREPSLGPVFGLKGGAVGGGKATIVPSDDINLHFTGDMHALTSSINLISAIIDNHIYQGNELNIDPARIIWKRALDINDRELRNVEIGLGNKNGIKRIDHFEITVANELMAILCLSSDEKDFIRRFNNIVVAYKNDGSKLLMKELKITNAILKLMKYALLPNVVQTLEGNPVIVHGGPFANIAHGCNSIIATKFALQSAPIVITEAGFGADLGAEKFFDIKCRIAGFSPDAVVLVATIRALKLHGGVRFEELDKENISALEIGIDNLSRHAENIKKFGVPLVIAINHFKSDTAKEIEVLESWCRLNGYKYAFFDSFLSGGKGAIELSNKVLETIDTKKTNFKVLYENNLSIKDKIIKICSEIYGSNDVSFSDVALDKIDGISDDATSFPICIAKTPLSFSDNPQLLNAPKDFKILVKDIEVRNGAEFIVVYLGNILTMPGLPKTPNAVLMENEND